MWFGPKGFASVVCGLLVLHGGIPAADEIFHLVALTITLSIITHSSTDVLVARLFDDEREMPTWYSSIRRRVRARPNDREGVRRTGALRGATGPRVSFGSGLNAVGAPSRLPRRPMSTTTRRSCQTRSWCTCRHRVCAV
jgi:hypothetical protein